MLCSILIPSLWRFDKLKQAIQSFINTAKADDYEVIVRLQDNDPESLGRQSELLALPCDLKITIGRPKRDGEGNNVLWDLLRPLAKGDWHQYWSDDMTISGRWADRLRELPTTGIIAQPEIHQLNNSKYLNDKLGPVPFIPKDAFESIGVLNLPDPIDTAAVTMLYDKGWKPTFLNGVGVHHLREADKTLPVA